MDLVLICSVLYALLKHATDYYCRGKAKGKGKVVPVLFLIEHRTMKSYWRDEA